MAVIGRTTLGLRFFGDDLDPAEITALLGVQPTHAARKGDVRTFKTARQRTERTGSWRLRVGDRSPGDLSGQIKELFSYINPDLGVWMELINSHKADLFCGLFMNESNEGVELDPETLATIGARGLRLGFDIYGPIED